MATRRKKPAKKKSGKTLFAIAASNKAYKAAKKAGAKVKAKADSRISKTWKKALAIAKRKIKSKR